MAEKGPKLKILPFDINGDRLDIGRLWFRWLERFERELLYQGVDTGAKPALAKAALLIYGGPDVEDIHDSLPDTTKPENVAAADWTHYRKSKEKLTQYFTPETCNDFAIFELINIKMRGDENVAGYTLRLREAAKKCDFTNWSSDKMIKALVISNMRDDELRLKLLQKDRTLNEVLTISKKKEDALARDKVLDKQREGESSGSGVNRLGGMWPNKRPNRKPSDNTKVGNANTKGGGDDECAYCGYEKHDKGKCPATQKECSVCNKTGHFARMCWSSKGKKPVKKVVEKQSREEDTESSEDGDCCKIDVPNMGNKTTLMRVHIDGTVMCWQPDTGTKRNLMDVSHLKEFEEKQSRAVKLLKSSAHLYPYGSDKELTVVGKFKVKFQAGKNEIEDTVYVTKEESEYPLICEDTAIELGLVTYNQEFIVKKVAPDSKRQIGERIVEEFPELFTGKIGKSAKRQVVIMTDKDVVPVAQKSRRIPVHLMPKAEGKLKQLMTEDIIERFPDNEPREWINPNVFAPKANNDIWFCLDMRLANTAILRPYTTIPTLAEVEAKFSEAERFSKLDLKEAYHQFELAPESRNLTTFYGPDGLYRFKRLNYGTKSAQDIMQIEMQRMLAGIPNQINMADDILIGGTPEEHDKALREVCSNLRDNGITLNPKKCIFDVREVTFVGLVFNREGIKPDPKNVKNLQEAKAPESQAELRSFLGMAGYSMRFIQDFAQIVHPLREQAKGR